MTCVIGGQAMIAQATDPNFSSVVALLHCDDFVDVKGNSYTNTGPVTIDNTNTKFGTYINGAFSFSGSSLFYTATSSTFSFSSNDFTLEAWVRVTDFSLDGTSQRHVFIITDGSGNHEISVGMNASGNFTFYTYEGGAYQTGTGGPKPSSSTYSTNTYYFVSYTRASNVHYLHVNGVNQGSFTYSGAMAGSSYQLILGAADLVHGHLKGQLDEVRITKGFARYSSANYTPPLGSFPDH